jgi:hypothetical protein
MGTAAHQRRVTLLRRAKGRHGVSVRQAGHRSEMLTVRCSKGRRQLLQCQGLDSFYGHVNLKHGRPQSDIFAGDVLKKKPTYLTHLT